MLFSFVVENYTNCFVTQNVNNINSGLRCRADSLQRYYSSVKVWRLEGAEKCSEIP